MVDRYYRHRVGNSAAALTYYMIFAFFPFLILLTALLGALKIPPIALAEWRAFIPADVIELIQSFQLHVQETTNAPLVIFGFVFSVYFPYRAVSSLMDFIALAYDTRDKRGPIYRGVVILLFSFGLMAAVVGSIVILLAGRRLLGALSLLFHLSAASIELWNTLRFLLLGALLLLLLTLLYWVAPGGGATLRQALPGAVGSLCCWLLYTVGFSYYVEHMGRYSLLYGSIGAIIVLLVWLYATAVTVILGAELNAALAKRRAERFRHPKK